MTAPLPELTTGGSHYTKWILYNIPLSRLLNLNDVQCAIDTCETKRKAREQAIVERLKEIRQCVKNGSHIIANNELYQLIKELEDSK